MDGSLLQALSVRARSIWAVLRGARIRLAGWLTPRRHPPTLPSQLGSQIRRLQDPRPPLHVLHVGKSGGTALKHALLEHLDVSQHRLLLHGHDVTLGHVPRGEQFMFTLRDPISRFVSAFKGRISADHPRYHYPWRDEERQAFAVFKTPDELASALSSADRGERTLAERAMRGIAHVNTPYRYWFGSLDSFRRRLSDVFFIAFQEQLDDDFELLKRRLGLPPHARLPSDPIAANRSLAPSGELGAVARANLQRWYEADLAFMRFCRQLAPLVNVEETPGRRSPAHAARTRRPEARRVALRFIVPPLAGVAAFAVTAALVEAFTDRNWTVSGFEWPADFVTAAVLVCLVPVVLSGLSALSGLLQSRRGGARTGSKKTGSAAD